MHGNRGCLGCCTKPTPITAVDEPSKGLKIQGRTVRKPSISEDFWSTSTYEMDNSGVQSQRSISSMSTSTQTLDHHGAGSTSCPSEFVNHGLLLWTQTRQQWLGNKKPDNRAQQLREPRLRRGIKPDQYGVVCLLCRTWGVLEPMEPIRRVVNYEDWNTSWNATYDNLLGTNKPFPQPVPLAEMVDFLVDVWEQEGMYD